MLERVEVKGVGKVYGSQRALQRIDLTLNAGELVALLGPNGAGKSTLLSILSTLLEPSEGTVNFSPTPSQPVRGLIGVIAHEPMCYGDLTGSENLELFARLYRVEKKNALQLLERVGLEDAATRPCRTYSRGMMQRLAVARALLHRPDLILCDEPFTGLDRSGAAMLGRLIAEEKARGAMVLCASHDFDALSDLVDRAVVLVRGRVTFSGALKERTGAALAAIYKQSVDPAIGPS